MLSLDGAVEGLLYMNQKLLKVEELWNPICCQFVCRLSVNLFCGPLPGTIWYARMQMCWAQKPLRDHWTSYSTSSNRVTGLLQPPRESLNSWGKKTLSLYICFFICLPNGQPCKVKCRYFHVDANCRFPDVVVTRFMLLLVVSNNRPLFISMLKQQKYSLV